MPDFYYPDEDYEEARKLGQKEVRLCTVKGVPSCLTSLEEVLPTYRLLQQTRLGVIQVPAQFLVGTAHTQRADCFAPNFMPLLPESSEFAAKWKSLCRSHLEVGIRDPIKAFEYRNRFYVEEGLEHTGAVNIISGIILDFRGFDTLGESHVLFIAACTVLLLLHLPQGDDPDSLRMRMAAESDDRHFEPRHDPILQGGAQVLVPLLIVFGAYILLNGHLSPGGGFSGGAVLGAGMILFLCAFGFKRSERFLTFKTFRAVTTAALVFYALSKGYVFFTGANGIANGISAGKFGAILSGGLMMPLNIAVGLVVACTMYALFTLFRKGDL